MTAINIIQTHDAIHILSDTAFIDADGTHVMSRAKVIALPLARCAVAVSGRELFLAVLPNVLCEATSIDEVLADLNTVFPRLLADAASEPGGNAYYVFVAGFTADGERQVWRIAGTVNPPAYTAIRHDADCQHYSPSFTPNTLRGAVGEARAVQFEQGLGEGLNMVDPIAHGLIAIDAQRRIPTRDAGLANGEPRHTVGGQAMHTMVTRDEIRQRVLKRWPDPLGGRIKGLTGYGSSDGIAAGSSSNYSVDTSGKKVVPTISAGSAIPGTTYIGDAAGGGGLAAAFDGTTSQTISTGAWKSGANASAYIGKNISGSPSTVGGATVTATSDFGFSGNAADSTVTVALYGKSTSGAPASGTDGTLLGTWSGTDSNGATATITSSDGTTLFKYVWIYITDSGSDDGGKGAAEVVLNAASFNNMTLVTTAQTADGTASSVRVLLEIDDSASPTLNTDLTIEVTCDGGTHWTAAPASSAGRGQAGRLVVETVDQACTGGTSVQARIKTLNNKSIPIYGTTVTWH